MLPGHMTIRRRASVLVLMAALLGGWPLAASAARSSTVEIKSRSASLGRVTRVVVDDGGSYVAADRLAAVLKGAWRVKGTRGTLTVGKRSAQFVRNQSRVVVQGVALALESAVRAQADGWLIPEDFLAKGLPRLAPGVAAAPEPAKAPKPAARPARAPGVAFQELRYRSYPAFTRVVVESGAALTYTVDSGPDDIRVRMPRLSLASARTEQIGDGLLREVRLEPGAGEVVLAMALDSVPSEVKASTLEDPFRIVLDVFRPRVAPSAPAPPRATPLRLIVLDAGHGGHDPGASGPTGVVEKDVVLDVTRRVARMVEDELGVKVALTRSSDVFVPLRERTNFANKQRADLFVSIHANAHPRAGSEGVETYFLSSEASDNDARQVAALENGVIQLESPASRAKASLLKSILWDLAQSEFQQASSFMAETVQDSMTRSLNLVNRGIKQAGFYVLGGAAMPAILIEIGFMTNPREEKKLASTAHREALARAILAGLAEYKRRYDQRLPAVALPARGDQ
jgi:N-acetylmuramoyl-L-alanine amidase